MNKEKLLSSLGLAQRASLIVSGEEMVLDAIRKGRAKLVFLANDAGPSTTKRVHDKSAFYGVPLSTCLTGEELTHSIGKTGRKVLCINDPKMAVLLNNTVNE